MNISINIDCTADEARRFLGLPDIADMQAQMLAEMQKRMMANIDMADPSQLMQTWLPNSLKGFEQMQKHFWGEMMNQASQATAKPKAEK